MYNIRNKCLEFPEILTNLAKVKKVIYVIAISFRKAKFAILRNNQNTFILFIYLFICLFVCLFIYLFIYLF